MNLVISNSYGTANLGDEAILHAMCEHYLNMGHRINVLTNTDAPPGRPLPPDIEVTLAGPRNTWHALHAIRNADLLLIGGGGIIQSKTSFGNLLFHMSRAWLAEAVGTPWGAVGIGAGPVPHRIGRSLLRWTFRRAQFVYVRDAGSARYLKNLGVTANVVEYTDLAFARAQLGQCADSPPESILHVGLSLRPPVGNARTRSKHDEAIQFAGKVLTAVRQAADALGKTVEIHFFSFNDEQDLAIGEALRQRQGNRFQVQLCPAEQGAEHQLDLIGKLDLMIGMRLHSVIFSALATTPAIAIAYDEKVREIASKLNLGVCTVDADVETGRLTQNIICVLSKAGSMRSALLEAREHERQTALECLRDALGQN